MVQKLAAVITTLDETNGAPESMLYIFFGMDMDLWSQVRHALIESGTIQIKNNFVTLTAKGKETAQKINETLAKAKNAVHS